MIYALNSPRIPLDIRRALAEAIEGQIEQGERDALRGNRSLVHVWDSQPEDTFCIYCNTCVIVRTAGRSGATFFGHQNNKGGIQKRYCMQIAEILDIPHDSHYDLSARRPGDF